MAQTPQQAPSLARNVIYHDPLVGDRAAIITLVIDRVNVNLNVFYDVGDDVAGLVPAHAVVPYSDDATPNTWSWPPRI